MAKKTSFALKQLVPEDNPTETSPIIDEKSLDFSEYSAISLAWLIVIPQVFIESKFFIKIDLLIIGISINLVFLIFKNE